MSYEGQNGKGFMNLCPNTPQVKNVHKTQQEEKENDAFLISKEIMEYSALKIAPDWNKAIWVLATTLLCLKNGDCLMKLEFKTRNHLVKRNRKLVSSNCEILDNRQTKLLESMLVVNYIHNNADLSDETGMTLAFAGTYLLVNFAPNITQALSARTVQYYFVGWQFLVYVILEMLIFCILLYFHKRKGMKHIVILLTLVALLASLTVISVKAVSGMITFSVTDKLQLTYPIFYIMFIIMIASCVFQVKFLNQAMKLYNTTTVVPINHIFFTTSAIIAGIIFYQEFLGAAFLTIFIYLFGCFLSFLGVFLVTRNREKEHLPQSYIDFGNIPGKQMLDKIQPDSNGLSYGTLPDGSDSTKSQSAEKKEV
ncbi:hypothetical protein HPG69_011649 [Diceros bicornis minor]|uniref:NIPA-like protein 2 n=1 Tax=Diceros bicornis minor TaxID=77932 RepID=A0A7J7EID9_DICBM|nr:hypothetical protein HPG69_011649 [Diceros bicornis minor]